MTVPDIDPDEAFELFGDILLDVSTARHAVMMLGGSQPTVAYLSTDYWKRLEDHAPAPVVCYAFSQPHPQMFGLELRHDPALPSSTVRAR